MMARQMATIRTGRGSSGELGLPPVGTIGVGVFPGSKEKKQQKINFHT